MREALEAEHLPGVVKAGVVLGDGARPGGQVLCPSVLLREEQVTVGCARVKGQGAPVCKGGGGGGGVESQTRVEEDLWNELNRPGCVSFPRSGAKVAKNYLLFSI